MKTENKKCSRGRIKNNSKNLILSALYIIFIFGVTTFVNATQKFTTNPYFKIAKVMFPPPDAVPPAEVTDLIVIDANIHSIVVSWTAPGDDGNSGQADHYIVRYSTSPITTSNWSSASLAPDSTLYQLTAGSIMNFHVNELVTGETYYIALKTVDVVGNISDLSNVVNATTYIPVQDSVSVNSLSDLQNAIDNAPYEGRVITLEAGTYNQTIGIIVENKNNITIQGETNNYDDTKIIGPGMLNEQPFSINIKVKNADYIVIRNLTIQDSYYHSIQIKPNSYYFHADNLKTWDNGESGFKVASPSHYEEGLGYADYGIIENCFIGNTTTARNESVEGIDIVAAKGWIIRGNTITRILKPSGNPGYAIFAKGNAIGTIIENNFIYDAAIALSFGGGGTGSQYFRNNDQTYEHRGGIMRNNIIYNMSDAGIYMNKANNFKVYNNTIIDIGPGTGAIETRFSGSIGEVVNNLTNGTLKPRNGGLFSVTSNNYTHATNSMFVNASGHDFHLVSSATDAIDQGMTLSEVKKDYDGYFRPQGTAYDIGAYEYVFCDIPTDLSVDNVTENGVHLSWDPSGNETQWEVIYGESGFNPSVEGTSVMVSGSPDTTINGLNPGTSYDFYVQSNCGGTDGSSDWTDVVSVTTDGDNTTNLTKNELNSIQFYPNPVNNHLTVKADHNVESLNVYNVTGEEILRLTPHSKIVKINTQNLKPGVYFLKIMVNQRLESRRFIK